MARTHRGYTILELLLSLAIVTILLTIIIPSTICLKKLIESQKNLYQDEIGIYQLQIQLASNHVVEINPDSIIYETYKNECEISLVNGNIVSQPGWLCYIYDVDDMCFEKHFGVIYLEYEREEQHYSYPIGYVE